MNRLTVSTCNSYSFFLVGILVAVSSSRAFFSFFFTQFHNFHNFFFTRILVSASFYTHFLTIHI